MNVQCYAGFKEDERPVRFELDGRDYVVEELLDRWYGTDHDYFKVRADDENVYILSRHRSTAEWSLESFRRA